MKDRHTRSSVTLRGSKEGQVPRYLEGQTRGSRFRCCSAADSTGQPVAEVAPSEEVQYELPEC